MPVRIELYGTACCHLCDQTKSVLREIGVVPFLIDIKDEKVLLVQYAIRIPVLRRVDSGAELGWPFDSAAVMRFLS
ncbi:MAG: glutaredoxin family protein [Gallionella sp.]|nr:glutaredoxin family protein [Gallionella sp.]